MTEEKREEVKKDAPETAQKSAESAQPAAESVAVPEAKKNKEVAIEKPANCASCNKSIKNKRWYYRNGKYYCSKRCWQTASKKDKTPEAQAAPQK